MTAADTTILRERQVAVLFEGEGQAMRWQRCKSSWVKRPLLIIMEHVLGIVGDDLLTVASD